MSLSAEHTVSPGATAWRQTPSRKVLAIMHQKHSSAGQMGNWLAEQGLSLDIRRPRFGDALPETLEDHAGAVIFGGPQSANDNDDFIRREIDWVGVALKEEKPLLGICLGAQMLALHLGAEVRPHAQGVVERGYHTILPTHSGSEMLDWPERVYQWHEQGFSAPRTSVVLAEGETFRNQAFRLGSAFGLQFHPEITRNAIIRLISASSPGSCSATTHLRHHCHYGPTQRQWLDGFMTKWIGLGQAEPEQLPAAA